MTTERRSRSKTPPGATVTADLKRIPLPALPHFRRPATLPAAGPTPTAPSGSVTALEMSELLGSAHEGGIVPVIEAAAPQRTGATGATILNDLVDEIEKGLEKDLARAPVDVIPGGYRRVVACAGGPLASRPAPSPAGPIQRRTGE